MSKDWLASVTYIGDKGTHYRTGYEANSAVYAPGATLANLQNRRVLSLLDPAQGAFYSAITTMDDGVNTIYNGMKVSVQRRFANNFSLLTSYTWSHCLQDAEPIGNRLTGNNTQNPFNRNSDRGACDFDLRHNFVTSFVYASPKVSNRAMDWALGDWRFSFLVSANSGFPFTPTTGVDASLSGVGLDRPDVVGSPYVRNTTTLQWISPAAFRQNAPGAFGNAGYNSLIGPHFVDADANLSRGFRIHENHKVDLRFEFFNVLNHTNFNAPVSRFASSTFGLIQSSGPARIIQLAAKYSF
jgi:hypothetical protein